MKSTLQIILSASAASVLACSAPAQDTANPKAERPGYTHDRKSHAERSDRLNGAAKASDLIGITVNNYQDEKLGKVEDLAVDVESGRVVQVILSTGGLLGVGDRLTAVPPGSLHHDVLNKVVHLDADKEKLKNAPEFEMTKWAECCDSEHLSKVYRHYGQESAYKFVHKGDAALESQRKIDDTRNTDGQRDNDGSLSTVSTRNADGTWSKDRLTSERQSMIPSSRLGQVQRASKLMGMAVKNRQNEKLGDVNNILVDLAAGRIVAVIVSSGGFLGLGDELSAVPPTAFRFSTDRNTLQLDASKEMLASAPHFKATQWPDYGQRSNADGIYRAYQVEPYYTNDATTDADNTQRNVRDRGERTLTPFDQGNSKADVDTTARIRKEIIAGRNMSVNAKNVKIITNEGRVTLRGPVNSAEEKRFIGEIAERIARDGNVDNQLEVKLNDRSTSN